MKIDLFDCEVSVESCRCFEACGCGPRDYLVDVYGSVTEDDEGTMFPVVTRMDGLPWRHTFLDLPMRQQDKVLDALCDKFVSQFPRAVSR